ncbi:CBS domain-containing protein [Nonomuraea sp. NPDC049649]|uniref:CBS domain-containing protein n=1 Tax=Nonomuraea sp. NPDC049649 TaxID=3155776 RepID=UPI0034380274
MTATTRLVPPTRASAAEPPGRRRPEPRPTGQETRERAATQETRGRPAGQEIRDTAAREGARDQAARERPAGRETPDRLTRQEARDPAGVEETRDRAAQETHEKPAEDRERPAVEELTAADVMSRVLVAVEPGESPFLAWELMRRAGVHHLPVVKGRHVLGVLTREDLAATWTCGPGEQSVREVGSLLSGRRRPRVMPGTPLHRVAAIMLDAGCDAVPVVREGGIVGLITVRDVLAAVAGRIEPGQEQGEPGELLTGIFRLQPILP